MSKYNIMILFIVLFILLISCEQDIKWINQYDEEADIDEIAKICKHKNAECGTVNYDYFGETRTIFCGECRDEEECENNKCKEDVDECADSLLNGCPVNSYCVNLNKKIDGKEYDCICKENYSGENCTPDTMIVKCEGLPENAKWNTVSIITQTWNGEEWFPSNKGFFSEETSTTQCRFKCIEDFLWNGKECVLNPCLNDPCQAVSNSTEKCSVTENLSYSCECIKGYFWSGDECLNPCENNPCDGIDYSTEICTAEDAKAYKCDCDENYTWNSSILKCEAGMRQKNCSSKPANTIWNDNGASGKFTQRWNGSAWEPESYTSIYSEAIGECRYRCASGCKWDGVECYENNCSSTSGTPCKVGTLTWSARTSNLMNWNSAVNYCDKLMEDGFSDWRLPNINELRTLIQNCSGTVTGGNCSVQYPNFLSASYCGDSCMCQEDHYPWGTYSKFGEIEWLTSSSTVSDQPDCVWYVTFLYGGIRYDSKKSVFYVRCVR